MPGPAQPDQQLMIIVDFWCSWFMSGKSHVVDVVPGLAEVLLSRVLAYEPWSQDPYLIPVLSWLKRFSASEEPIEVGCGHAFHRDMLELVRRHMGD